MAITSPVVRPHRDIGTATSWFLAFVVTALASAILIRNSMDHGALALPPTFDDVSYFLDGARYLDILDAGGPLAALRIYLAAPPHAPISTGAALAGFAIFGMHNWVGAVTNAVALFLFSALFLRAARNLPSIQSVCLLGVLWCSPFVGLTLWWFRPDMIASLVIAAGCAFIVTRGDWPTDRRAWLIGGCFFGAALWAKPAIFPLTIALFEAAIVLASISPRLRSQLRDVVVAGLTTTIVGLLISLPYYAFSLQTVIEYIRVVVFGEEAAIWVKPLPLWESLTFYFTGYYGVISVGWWMYLAPVVGIVCLGISLWGGRRQSLGPVLRLLAFVLLSYVAVTVPTFKGPHGYPFAASLLVATGLGVVFALRAVPRVVASVLCACLLLVSIALFVWPYTLAHRFVTLEEAQNRRIALDQTIQALGDDLRGKTVFFSSSSNFLNFSSVEFRLRELGKQVPAWLVLHTIGDIKQQSDQLPAADIVVAYSPDNNGLIPSLPTATPEFRSQFIDAVSASKLFGSPLVVPDIASAGSLLVFKKL